MKIFIYFQIFNIIIYELLLLNYFLYIIVKPYNEVLFLIKLIYNKLKIANNYYNLF